MSLPSRSMTLLDEPLSAHTTFRIGGPADVWVEVTCSEVLARLVRFCAQRGIAWWVLGRGSNVLISDAGLRGMVMHLAGDFCRIETDRTDRPDRTDQSGSVLIRVGAGAMLDHIAEETVRQGLHGAEFLAGIPGTAGGALHTNAGAFGRMLSDITEQVTVMDAAGQTRCLAGAELVREYRKPVIPAGLVALELRLRLESGPPGPSDMSLEEIRRLRRMKQPSEPSAGSYFKNPPSGSGADPARRIPAGKLIEECGFKGRKLGGAQVSEKHANFIVNTGSASACDVYELAQVVQAGVEEKTGILLEPEVQVLP